MKYYQYVSDTKVDMLFAQIPVKLSKKLSAQLKVDLKVVSLTLTPETSAATRYSKCRMVTEYLQQQDATSVGTIEHPEYYFAGSATVMWFPLDSTVVWIGQQNRALFALTGSLKHLTGAPKEPDPWTTDSQAMAKYTLSSQPPLAISDVAAFVEPHLAPGSDEPRPEASQDRMDAVGALEYLMLYLPPELAYKQRVEFIAVKHAIERGDRVQHKFFAHRVDQVVLGSPLYVALA